MPCLPFRGTIQIVLSHMPTSRPLCNRFLPECLPTFSLLTLLRLNFSLSVSNSKIDNSPLNTTHSACNLGFIFDEHLTFSGQISSLSKSCYSHIRELRCIRPYLDSKTASRPTIAASIVHYGRAHRTRLKIL